MRISKCARQIGTGLFLFLLASACAENPSNTGLWVGTVVVESINRPGPASAAWDTKTNLPAANPFSFRVIIHVDVTNQARLIQRVLLAYSANSAQETNILTGQVTTNGTYRLLSDESKVAGIQQTNAQSRVTRISSVNFPLMTPQPLNGQFGIGGTLNGVVPLPYDDLVNPFVHVYAPLHDNWQVQNDDKSKLPAGVESFDITRNVSFQFAAQDPLKPTNPKWGVDENGGDFRETIEGLYQPVQVQGRFRIQRLTTIGQLE